jgi:sulfofructose kinase
MSIIKKEYSKEIDVLVVGRACVDYIAVIDRYPAENMKIQLNNRLVEGGGQGATSSCCISRLGGRVIYLGRVGDDGEGQFCLKRLGDFGVSTEYVDVVKGGITPVAYILVTDGSGSRTIVYEPSRLPLIEFDDRMVKLLKASKVALLDPQVTHLSRWFRSNRKFDFKIVYDCERSREGIYDMMKIADYFIPSSDFFSSGDLSLEGETFRDRIYSLKKMIDGELIVTNGEDGAYWVSGNKLYHFYPLAVDVKDTTGAGDNFHAAFSFAISRDMDHLESVRFSVAVASLSCRDYGGRRGLPTIQEARDAAGEVRCEIE